MNRLSALLVLGGFGLLFTPSAASAQFGPPFGSPFGFPPGTPVIVPSTNPFFYVPQYRYTSGAQITAPTLFGNATIGYRQTAWSVNPPWTWGVAPSYPLYMQGGSYMMGTPNVRGDLVLAAQRDLAKAQREASVQGARDQISGQW